MLSSLNDKSPLLLRFIFLLPIPSSYHETFYLAPLGRVADIDNLY